FVVREIVGDRSAAGAFVASDLEVVEIGRAVLEAQRGPRFVHPGAAKTGALRGDAAFAGPRRRVAARTADGETNGGRTRPDPFSEKPAELRRTEGAKHHG